MDSQPAEPLLPSRARAQQDDDGEAVRCSRCRLSSCMCWCCTALCCLAAAALYFGIAVLSTWYRVHSVEPLDLLLLEGHMGCDESKLVDESFAHFGDRSISSKANDKYAAKMKNAKAADEVIRVQIINGSLFTTCAGHGAEKAASIDCTLAGLRSRGAMMVHVLRTLDLLLSIGRVPDVDFFIDLSEHACYHHQTKNAKGADAWPVLTVETDDEKRCHNILGPRVPSSACRTLGGGSLARRRTLANGRGPSVSPKRCGAARRRAAIQQTRMVSFNRRGVRPSPPRSNGPISSLRSSLDAAVHLQGSHTHSCPPPTVLRALITQCHHTDSCCALCTMCMQARRCGQNRWWASLRPVRTRAST